MIAAGVRASALSAASASGEPYRRVRSRRATYESGKRLHACQMCSTLVTCCFMVSRPIRELISLYVWWSERKISGRLSWKCERYDEALGTEADELCRMSESRKRRAIFLGTGVSASVRLSVMVSVISTDAAALPIQNPMQSLIFCFVHEGSGEGEWGRGATRARARAAGGGRGAGRRAQARVVPVGRP